MDTYIQVLEVVGKTFYTIPLIIMGAMHFTNHKSLVAFATSKKVPFAKIAVPLSGAVLMIGAAGILLDVNSEISALLLVLFFIPVTLIMHNFWSVKDPMQKAVATADFMKNVVMLGAALMYAGI